MQYFLKRVLISIPTLFLVATFSFFLVHIAPGGPFTLDHSLPPAIMKNLLNTYHLNDPVWKQYLYFLNDLLHGNLGVSFQYKNYTVNDLIGIGWKVSFTIGGLAIIFSFIIGTLLGTVAAVYHNKLVDYFVMTFSVTGVILPNFVVAPLLSLIFGVLLNWLPVQGWGDSWKEVILPVVALALPQIGYISRLMRSSMIETLSADFIRTAKAKGLSPSRIIFLHAFKGALLPVISYLGPAVAAVLTGSVVIEEIFGLPGIGRFFVNGALNRDYTLVMGVVIFYSFIIVAMNLLVDLVYSLLDPRIKEH